MFFFEPGDVLAGFLNDHLRILLGELPELGVTGQRALDRGQFLGRNMPGVILARLPALEFVMRA